MQLEYILDEFRPYDFECIVYGVATIDYRDTNDWSVSDVVVDQWNGEIGKSSATKQIALSKEHPLARQIASTLEGRDAELIEDAIRKEMQWWRDNELAQRGKDRNLEKKIWGW